MWRANIQTLFLLLNETNIYLELKKEILNVISHISKIEIVQNLIREIGKSSIKKINN